MFSFVKQTHVHEYFPYFPRPLLVSCLRILSVLCFLPDCSHEDDAFDFHSSISETAAKYTITSFYEIAAVNSCGLI